MLNYNKNFSRAVNFLSDNFLVILILFLALSLRVYHLDRSIWLQAGYDESRDMLVASHIINYGDSITSGPLALGGMGWLKNSPIYFYFIAAIYFIASEPTSFMYVWAIVMTIPVILGFMIGKTLRDTTTGLILAVLLAVNRQMVFSGRELLQPHLLLIFSLGFIWSITSFHVTKKHKTKFLITAIVFLLLPLHFHYGILIALPLGTLWIFKYWYDLNSETKPTVYSLFSPILVYFGLIFSWLLLTYRLILFDQFYFLLLNFKKEYTLSFFPQLKSVLFTLNTMLWSRYSPAVFTIFFLFLAAIIIFKTNKNWFSFKPTNQILLFLLSMPCSILIFGLYHQVVAETYLLFIFPFLLTLLAIMLRQSLKMDRALGWILIMYCFVMMLRTNFQQTYKELPTESYHNQQKKAASIIYSHYSSNQENTYPQPKLLVTWYTTSRNMPFDRWGTSGIWYYLERYFDQKLVENSDYGVNFVPLEKFPTYIYMICDFRRDPQLVNSECVERFMGSYPIVDNKLELLNSSNHLSVWVVSVDQSKKTEITNVVHQELLTN